MKKAILTFILLATASAAHARSPRPQVDTPEFVVEICTATTISISSSVATNLLTSSVNLSSATFMEVYNVDATNIINLGYTTEVSTISSENAYGREVRPTIGVGLQLNSDKIVPYAKTQKTTASTRATITQCK